MSEPLLASHELMTRPLSSMVAIDPESLPLGTSPSFEFHYVDISCAANGRLQIPDTSITHAEAPSRARRIVKNGDVLMSTVRPNLKAFAYCNLPEGRYVASTGFAVLRAIEGNDPRYILYSILSDDVSRQIDSYVVGSNYPAINSSDIQRLCIPDWKPSQQYRIAEILSTVDETIEQTEALIAKYQQIKAGLMHDLFTCGVTPDGHLRPTRAQAPHLYKESPLGWIPKEWDCVATEDKVRVIDAQPDHRTPPEVVEGYPYIGIGDISPTGEILFGQARRVSSTAFTKQLNSFEVEPGAFIFGKIGTLGSPTRIPHERLFAISANVVLLTSKVMGDASFAFWLYHSQWVERQISDATNTTSQPALGIQKIRKFILPWPSTNSERAVITSRLETMLQVRQSLEREKHKMHLFKHGLMHDLLTGRVRVKVAERASA